MKEYTTLEAIAEMMKDTSKKFIGETCLGNNAVMSMKPVNSINGNLTLTWSINGKVQETMILTTTVLDYTWTLVQKPVTFAVAFQAAIDGKKIRHELWSAYYSLSSVFANLSGYSTECIKQRLMGDWFIEE